MANLHFLYTLVRALHTQQLRLSEALHGPEGDPLA
jgi:hypothetical protein